MTESASINLATVGTAELDGMSVQVFTSCLETMSGDAIARFRRMRKLNSSHRQALEKFLLAHPDKRPGGANDAAPLAPAKSAKHADAGRRSRFADFRQRLRAWWDGVEVTPAKPHAKAPDTHHAAKGAAKAAEPPHPKTQRAPASPMSRVEMLQKLWGEGFAHPGGEDFALRLAQGVAFDGERPCLDLRAGLGGAARALGRAHNVVIEGLEIDPDIAAAGSALSLRLGVGEQIQVRASHPPTEEFDDGRYGAIFAREMMFALPDRKAMLARLYKALVPGGALVITDYVLGGEENAAVSAWRAAEPATPIPATAEEYSEALAALGFSVGGFDDLSADYISLIQTGWKQMHQCLQSAQLPPETATMLMTEGNLWLARSRALESGGLRLLHFVAHQQAEVS